MIKGFWHIYAVNHWFSIVQDQVRILITSGLYDEAKEIVVGFIGDRNERQLFEKWITSQYPKIHIKFYGEDPGLFEFPTLRLIEMDPQRFWGFYFHTKGVTRPNESVINYWRAWLNESILNRWRFHTTNLWNGYEISGVNFCKSPDHYSGNFWWFRSDYIKRLPKTAELDQSNRFHAEQWIFMNKRVKAYKGEFMEPGEGVFKIRKP